MVSGDSLLEDALRNLGRVAVENEKKAEENGQRELEYEIKADTAYDFLSGVARDLIVDSRARRFFYDSKEIVLFEFPVRNGKKTRIGYVMLDELCVLIGNETVRDKECFYKTFRRYSGINDDEGIKGFLDKINRGEILKIIADYSID